MFTQNWTPLVTVLVQTVETARREPSVKAMPAVSTSRFACVSVCTSGCYMTQNGFGMSINFVTNQVEWVPPATTPSLILLTSPGSTLPEDQT